MSDSNQKVVVELGLHDADRLGCVAGDMRQRSLESVSENFWRRVEQAALSARCPNCSSAVQEGPGEGDELAEFVEAASEIAVQLSPVKTARTEQNINIAHEMAERLKVGLRNFASTQQQSPALTQIADDLEETLSGLVLGAAATVRVEENLSKLRNLSKRLLSGEGGRQELIRERDRARRDAYDERQMRERLEEAAERESARAFKAEALLSEGVGEDGLPPQKKDGGGLTTFGLHIASLRWAMGWIEKHGDFKPEMPAGSGDHLDDWFEWAAARDLLKDSEQPDPTQLPGQEGR